MKQETGTVNEKLIVCGTSFAFACLAFALSVLFLVPLSAQLAIPGFLNTIVILALLFILPVAGAVGGISIGEKALQEVE